MTHPDELRMEAIVYADEHGDRAAAKRFGVSPTSIGKWKREAAAPVQAVMGTVVALAGAEVVEPNAPVPGLPVGVVVADIDPQEIDRLRTVAHLYADRRRAELRIELADAAIHLSKKLREEKVGREAQGWARALGDVIDRLRLESGQVTSLSGKVDLRAALDAQQTAQLGAGRGQDVSVPVVAKANVIEIEDDDA